MANFFRWAALILVVLAFSGCTSTKQQSLEGELAIVKAARIDSETVLSEIKSGTLPPDFDVQISLKMDVVNRAFAAVDQAKFYLPNDPSIEITLGEIKLSTFGTLPTVLLKSKAVKGSLSADIEVTAVLIPKLGGLTGEMSIQILSFVPKVTWYFFEITKSHFVRALLATELAKLNEKLPTIQLPIEETLILGGQGKATVVRFQTSDHPSYLSMNVTYPTTERNRKLRVLRYIFFSSGINVYGAFE